jgi:carbohydrate diacid regulator
MAKIMQAAYYGKRANTLFYSDCIFELCLGEVPQHYKEAILSSIFGACSPKDISDYCAFINTYIESNGSLKLIAEKLFTHTNTVQYRIERLRQKTGLDLRSYPDAFQLYAASLWAGRSFRPEQN